jgi:hypothetical protein
MSTPAEVLGVSSEILETTRQLLIHTSLQNKKANGIDPWDTAAMLCISTDGLCNTYYLRGEWDEMCGWAARNVACVDEYLFGDWRNIALTDNGIVEPDWWFRSGIGWTLDIAHALCWGSVTGMWDEVDRLLMFPTEKVAADTEGARARAYYLGLARWWRDRSDVEWTNVFRNGRDSEGKDYLLRSDVLVAIGSGEVVTVANAVRTYLEFWLRTMKTSPQHLAQEGSFLWHVAQNMGFRITLSEELAKHVIVVP